MPDDETAKVQQQQVLNIKVDPHTHFFIKRLFLENYLFLERVKERIVKIVGNEALKYIDVFIMRIKEETRKPLLEYYDDGNMVTNDDEVYEMNIAYLDRKEEFFLKKINKETAKIQMGRNKMIKGCSNMISEFINSRIINIDDIKNLYSAIDIYDKGGKILWNGKIIYSECLYGKINEHEWKEKPEWQRGQIYKYNGIFYHEIKKYSDFIKITDGDLIAEILLVRHLTSMKVKIIGLCTCAIPPILRKNKKGKEFIVDIALDLSFISILMDINEEGSVAEIKYSSNKIIKYDISISEDDERWKTLQDANIKIIKGVRDKLYHIEWYNERRDYQSVNEVWERGRRQTILGYKIKFAFLQTIPGTIDNDTEFTKKNGKYNGRKY